MIPYVDSIGQIAAFIGYMTVIGGALIWIYQKFIGGPREKKRAKEEEKRYVRILEVVSAENEPLINAIDNLTSWLEESKADRKQLHVLANTHADSISENVKKIAYNDGRLDGHHDRILILEVKAGIRRTKSLEGVRYEEMDSDE